MARSADRRVIGRILSLGFPMPGARVDNYNFLTAPSFFDYDALIVAPAALAALVEDICDGREAATFAGALVVNGAVGAGEESLRDVLLRRRSETDTLLSRGGAVICFATPPTEHTRIDGLRSLDDYYWLPDDLARFCRAPVLLSSDGTQSEVVDFEHPLAAFALGQSARTAYRARFDESAIGGRHVFVRSRGGVAIGIEPPSNSGRLVMLPSLASIPAGDERYVLSDSLQDGIRRLLHATGEGREPPWTADYAVPGLSERADVLAFAQRALDVATSACLDAQAGYDELARYRRLLWQEGAAGLDELVIDALHLIGFEVRETDASSREIWFGGEGALLEIESSDRPVDLAPHYRLRQRIERAIERRNAAPRGLLIVNGRRSTAPSEREEEVAPALRTAAETLRYCVAPSRTLFAAVVAHLAGRQDDVAAYRSALLHHDGVLAVENGG